MSYTVWHRGRLVGESDLGFVRWQDDFRSGWFFATEYGQTVGDIIAAPRLALLEAGKLSRAARRANAGSVARSDPEFEAANAEMDAAGERAAAIERELELRGPDGRVISTKDIDVRDIDVTMRFGEEHECERALFGDDDGPLDPELEAAIEHDFALLEEWGLFDEEEREPWRPEEPEPERPRYQLHVTLVDRWDIP